MVKMDDDVFFNAVNLVKFLKSKNFNVQVGGRLHTLYARDVVRYSAMHEKRYKFFFQDFYAQKSHKFFFSMRFPKSWKK